MTRTQLGRRFGSAWILLAFCAVPFADVSAQVSFTDVTVAAGIDHVQWVIPDPLVVSGPEFMNGGAAAGDYDHDGWIDLYVTCFDGPDTLYRNKGDGTFEDVTAQTGFDQFDLKSNGAAWADIDNDGDLDLYVTTQLDTRFYLFINDGSGFFTEEGLARGAAIDSPDTHFGYSVAFGDYNLDGYVDIHTTEWRRDFINPTAAASNSRLLRNLGPLAPGYFIDSTLSAGVEMDSIPLVGTTGTTTFTSRFVDFDQDGWPDLSIAADFGSSRLFWNDGDGTFTDGTAAAGVGSDENGMGSAVADYDGDGRLDWFVTSIYDPLDLCNCLNGLTGNRLYRNLGNRTFADATDAAGVRDAGWGWGAVFLDFDNDGDQDLAVNNGQYFPPAGVPGAVHFQNDAARLFRNDGGSMTDVAIATGLDLAGSGKGILTFDYDQDGDLDLFLITNAGQPHLFRNDGGTSNDWLRVRVRGMTTNLEGLNARVELTAAPGGPVQVREIFGGSHFLGQSEVVAHFGLGPGPGPPVHKVRVVWPARGTSRSIVLTDVPRNQLVFAIEPLGDTCGLVGLEPAMALGLAMALRGRAGRRGRSRR